MIQVCFRQPLCPLFPIRPRFLNLVAVLIWPLSLAAAEENRIAGLYARGLGGEQQAVVDCIAALEARLAQQPNDQLARVYLGSAWTLRSRDLSFGPGKLSALRKGIALMDEAAAAAPNDARVLLLRAVTNESLPAILGRRKPARQPLEDLVALVETNPSKLTPSDCQLLYLNAGAAAKRAGDPARAKQLWQRGLTIEADAKLRREMVTELAQL